MMMRSSVAWATVASLGLAVLPHAVSAGLIADVNIPDEITAKLDPETREKLDKLVGSLKKLGENLVAASQSVDPLAIKTMYEDNQTLSALNNALQKELDAARKAKPLKEYTLRMKASHKGTVFDVWVGADDRHDPRARHLTDTWIADNSPDSSKPQTIRVSELGPGRHTLHFYADRPGAEHFNFANFELYRPDNDAAAVYQTSFFRRDGGQVQSTNSRSYEIWLTYDQEQRQEK